MPISVIGSKNLRFPERSEDGFSLIELMVVLAIIGLLASVVVLSMPDPRGRLVDQGEAFAARARAAQEAAIVEAQDMALWVSPTGYGFERYHGDGWTPVAAPPFNDRQWPEDTTVTLAGQANQRTRVIFSATGLNDPLAIDLARDADRISVTIGADGDIHVGS